jgi:hypothetical protein
LAPGDKSGLILASAGIDVNMEVMLIAILPRNEQILIAILKGMAEAIEYLRECYGEPSSTERGAYAALK